MASVHVHRREYDDGYAFQVVVREGGTETHHTVTLETADYERIAGGRSSPEFLVQESFRFLLEREPKESILRSFDLTVISRYFPDYEQLIQTRL
jgi:hypothetical protein